MKKLTDLQRELSKAVDDIMQNFEWNKVWKTMVALDWTWAFSTTENKVPSIEEIKSCARRLLEETIVKALSQGQDWSIATGGFEAKVKFYEDEDRFNKIPIVELRFIVDSWEYEIK